MSGSVFCGWHLGWTGILQAIEDRPQNYFEFDAEFALTSADLFRADGLERKEEEPEEA